MIIYINLKEQYKLISDNKNVFIEKSMLQKYRQEKIKDNLCGVTNIKIVSKHRLMALLHQTKNSQSGKQKIISQSIKNNLLEGQAITETLKDLIAYLNDGNMRTPIIIRSIVKAKKLFQEFQMTHNKELKPS